MSEAAQQTRQDFWRAPSPAMVDELVRDPAPTMAEVCSRCGTEFLLGSRFCHACGGRRPEALNAIPHADTAAMSGLWRRAVTQFDSVAGSFSWRKLQLPSWLRYLHFHEIKRWAGLSTGSLIAFVIGVGCIAGALLVGLLTARTFVDWQAIQFYRAEWLLAATASFVAGILLKKPSDRDGN